MTKTTLLLTLLLFFSFRGHSQAVSNYSFTESTETYVAVAGNNSTATGDDGTQYTGIGFTFNFGGIDYATYSISTNGFIRLGSPITGNHWTNGLNNTALQAPLIAPFWEDNNRNTGSIQSAVTGVLPNRILEVGWDNINIGGSGGTNATQFASFKIRLHETTGQIDFIYGPVMNFGGSLSASIGLNDSVSFLSVLPAFIGASTSSVTASNAIGETAGLLGKKYTFLPQPPCAGMPAPGNTLSSAVSVCPDIPFMLSLQNPANGAGVTYQWQVSSDGLAFENIGGATQITLLRTQSAGSFYQCNVTCSGQTAASTPVQVTMTQPNLCYCMPTYTQGKTEGDLISNVVIAGTTLSNNTGTAPVNPYYTYFTGQPNYTTTLQAGEMYEMSVTVGTFAGQNVAVWIDFDDDGVFSEAERIGFTETEIGSGGTGIFTIDLPCDPLPGLHRMRVRDVYDNEGSAIDPCANYGYGETEDYDVTILAGSGCQAPYALAVPVINSTSVQLSWGSGCNQVAWNVHITEAGGGIPTGTPSYPDVVTMMAANDLIPDTDYEFYVQANCGAEGESDWVGPVSFTTGPPAVANDECGSAVALIPGGTFEEHAVVATNIGASKTIGVPNPTCAAFAFGGDVWFSVTVPEDGNITIETRSNPGSPILDTGLNAFSGDCGSLSVLACSDDATGIGGFSRIALTGRTPGEIIYARAWEYANDVLGTFQVSAYNTSLGTISFDALNFKHYPNPVKDILNLSHTESITQVKAFNLLGQEVINEMPNAPATAINMSALPDGAYIFKVTVDGQTKAIRIIKE